MTRPLAAAATDRSGRDVGKDTGPDDRAPTATISAHHGGTDLEEAQAMGELQPRMRAGDKDRQRVVEQLGKHFGEGRLTIEEFDERVIRAHASVYLDELPALTADLPSDPEQHPQPHRRPTRSAARVPGM